MTLNKLPLCGDNYLRYHCLHFVEITTCVFIV